MEYRVRRRTWFLLFILWPLWNYANDSVVIKVHFLYGSKPDRSQEGTGQEWFGGKWGGHVGIEIAHDQVIDFLPSGGFHIFRDPANPQSHFVQRSLESFWETFGSPSQEVKKLSITIPVSAEQKRRLDSVAAVYLHQTPYDYAFFGMRCASAAYDLLGKAGIFPDMGEQRTVWRYFYPKPLRKKLIRTARRRGWELHREKGTETRNWEQDPRKKR